MKTLQEIDNDLIDVVWSLLEYPEHCSISDALSDIERQLDKLINEEVDISEAETRDRA